MLSCKVDSDSGKLKNSDSGETSLAQKFGDDNFGNGNTLDDLFANKEYQVIWNNWIEILKKKYLFLTATSPASLRQTKHLFHS